MVYKVKLKDYSLEELLGLLSKVISEDLKDEIIELIIQKQDYSLFYCIGKFKSTKGYLKELYADLVLIKSTDIELCQYELLENELLVRNLLEYASLYYIAEGRKSKSVLISKMCEAEYFKFYFEGSNEAVELEEVRESVGRVLTFKPSNCRNR